MGQERRAKREKGKRRTRERKAGVRRLIARKVEEPRSKEGKRNENGARIEKDIVADREVWEKTSVDGRRKRRREENEGGLEEKRCSERVSRREDRRKHGELVYDRRSAEVLVKERGTRRGNGRKLERFQKKLVEEREGERIEEGGD